MSTRNKQDRPRYPFRRKCPVVNASTVNPLIKVLMIKAKIKRAPPKLYVYPSNICYKAPAFGASAYIRFPAIRDDSSWRVGWIQACTGLNCKSYYSKNERSSWEIPATFDIISDADGSNMPFYGSKHESVLLRGPRKSVWYGSVTITDQLLSDISLMSKHNCTLKKSSRHQNFIVWLAVINCTTNDIQPIKTIKWSITINLERQRRNVMNADKAAENTNLATKCSNTYCYSVTPDNPTQPVILLENLPIPHQCLNLPLLSKVQRLVWYYNSSDGSIEAD